MKGRAMDDDAIYIDNDFIDKYLPKIGPYGFGIYSVILCHLSRGSSLSYTEIARTWRTNTKTVRRHVQKLQQLKLLEPDLHFIDEEER
jgi:hypothetical protein